MKILLLIISFIVYGYAVKPSALQYSGVNVEHTYSNGVKENIKIRRNVDAACLEFGLTPENFDKENIAKNVPDVCKKTFVTTRGSILPLYINDKIKTYSEIEVLNFIYHKVVKEPSKYVLVDSRKKSWFDKGTIPSSKNVPFEDLRFDEDFEEEFKTAYKNLGVKVKENNKLDFSEAKTAVFFCNGPWCPLSSRSIKYLNSLGYPADKLIWYRGGISAWEAVHLNLTKELK